MRGDWLKNNGRRGSGRREKPAAVHTSLISTPPRRSGVHPSLIAGTVMRIGAAEPASNPPAEPPKPSPEEALERLEREAALVLSAMEAADGKAQRSAAQHRPRREARARYQVRAQLALWADGDSEPWTLFTRDVSARAMGFICQDRLPLGYGGILSFAGPCGRREQLQVTVTRCTPCSAGWFEGALHFEHPQEWLLEEAVRRAAN